MADISHSLAHSPTDILAESESAVTVMADSGHSPVRFLAGILADSDNNKW